MPTGPALVRHTNTALYFLAAWLIALGTRFPELYKPMHSDYSMWLRIARDWAGGQQLYEETYDNKQPLIFLILRLIDSDNPKLSLLVAQSLLAAAGAVVLRQALTAMAPVCGWAAPLVLVAWSSNVGTSGGCQSTEAFALWFDVIALSCFALAARHSSALLMFGSGISFCICISLRIPSVLHGVAYLPLVFLLIRHQGIRVTCGMVGAFGLGIASGLGAQYAHAETHGYTSALLQVLENNFYYGSLTRVSPRESIGLAFDELKGLCQESPVAVVLVGMTLLVMAARFRRLAPDERTCLLICVLWLVAAIAGAFPGGRHFAHYYHFIWSPLSILAVLWLAPIQNLREPPGIPGRMALGLVGGVCALALASAGNDYWKWRKQVAGQTDPMIAIEKAAGYLEANTKSDTVVPVCVWGNWAELYWRVPRPSVTRCTMPACIPGLEPAMFQEWVEAMLRQKPPLIIADTSMLHASGKSPPADSYISVEWLAGVGPVQRMIDTEYEVVHELANPYVESKLIVLARRDGVAPKK